MIRRPSPLAQSNSNSLHLLNSNSNSNLPSYRNSSASSSTITSIPSNNNNNNQIPHLNSSSNQFNHDTELDSDTTSEIDLPPPGHRSTPGTSLDSSNSNLTQPEEFTHPKANLQFNSNPSSISQQGTYPIKHSKHSLGNKLRRALNINSLQDNLIHNSIPELDSPVNSERLKSSSASIAGVPLSSSTNSNGKLGNPIGTGRRFGFLNPKSNSSTDNLSISSTVSSASVMIRRLGNLGRSARRSNVMGLTKIFKDKNEISSNSNLNSSTNSNTLSHPSQIDKLKSNSSQHKNLASTSVTQVQAEIDRSLSNEFPGMTPAAAFIHKQKQQFAQQEAAAAAVATHSTTPPPFSSQISSDSLKSKSKVILNDRPHSTINSTATEARKKMIEKEKEKLKSNKKSRKWGFSTFVGSSSSQHPTESIPTSSTLVKQSNHSIEDEVNLESDDTTFRQTKVDETLNPNRLESNGKSIEVLKEQADSDDDEDDDDDDDDDGSADYDMESLFENSSGDAVTSKPPGLRPRPSKEAVPKKGILKNAQSFSQDSHLSPSSLQSKSLSAVTTPDSTISAHLTEDPNQLLPQLGKNPSTLLLSISSNGPDLSLSLNGLAIKDRRAKFAQHLSVHTTWPAAIYDRRGELATCNRLTPTLAQRIKEEINAFKMEEMDVHFASRAHTHFFV